MTATFKKQSTRKSKSHKYKRPDLVLLTTLVLLLAIGLLALFSASVPESEKDFGNIYGYFLHQVMFGFAGGLIAAFVLYLVPYRYLKKLALPLFAASLGLMFLVFVPGAALTSASAQRWIDLRIAVFQPSELAKLAFIIFLAAWLETHYKRMNEIAHFLPFMMLTGVLVVLLAFQPDFSTLLLVGIIAAVMYFSAGGSLKYVGWMAGLGTVLGGLLIAITPYRLNRIVAFLDPNSDPLNITYQVTQTLIAIGSGQWWGTGVAQGIQKQRFLPEPMTDSIFAVWTEETGFLGGLVLIGLFLVFLWRGFRIAERSIDKFARLCALGITVWLFVQALFNMGAMLGIFPLTGIPLPFISYGSSALVIELAAMGLLLQFSRHTTSV
jgi:cell division protein FtsW